MTFLSKKKCRSQIIWLYWHSLWPCLTSSYPPPWTGWNVLKINHWILDRGNQLCCDWNIPYRKTVENRPSLCQQCKYGELVLKLKEKKWGSGCGETIQHLKAQFSLESTMSILRFKMSCFRVENFNVCDRHCWGCTVSTWQCRSVL